jgi:hypothetical protein
MITCEALENRCRCRKSLLVLLVSAACFIPCITKRRRSREKHSESLEDKRCALTTRERARSKDSSGIPTLSVHRKSVRFIDMLLPPTNHVFFRYGIPSGQTITFSNNTALVWGPGTYGYLTSDVSQFFSENNVNSNVNLIVTTGFPGVPGGDNFGECSLDTQYSSAISTNLNLQVSNTNTSQSTEEVSSFVFSLETQLFFFFVRAMDLDMLFTILC